MSHIHRINTSPEMIVRKYLFAHGLRYRIDDKRYSGHPDIVLPKYNTVIFVNGCFWHLHENCPDFVMPKSHQEYWIPKLKHNQQRDIENIKKLKANGWNVIVVWECELKKGGRETRLKELYNEITNYK